MLAQLVYALGLVGEKYDEEDTMSKEHLAPETKGVAVKLVGSVDLGPEIEGMAGRQILMRPGLTRTFSSTHYF